MIFFRIALLSMQKHLRRTIIIVVAVGLSVAVMVFIEGLLSGLSDSFFESLFQSSGHLQIHGEGYSDRLDPYSTDYLVRSPGNVVARLTEDPRVRTAEQVEVFGGMLSNGEKNMPTVVLGLVSDTAYWGNAVRGLTTGRFVESVGEIAISTRTADLLDTGHRDSVVVLVEDTTGSPYYAELTVVGLFRTDSSSFDTSHVFVTHEQADELLYLDGATTEVRATLHTPSDAPAVKSTLEQYLSEADLEAATWQEIHGSFVVAFELFDVFLLFIDGILIVVAATVIANAVLMNVFERSAEFGTLRAIGMKRRQQALMILAEGSLEGTLGSLIGLAVGIPLVAYLGSVGVQIGEYGEDFGLGRVIYPSVTMLLVIRSFIGGILISLASSGYASLVSARQRILSLLGQA